MPGSNYHPAVTVNDDDDDVQWTHPVYGSVRAFSADVFEYTAVVQSADVVPARAVACRLDWHGQCCGT